MSRSPTERLLMTPEGLLDTAGRPWDDFAGWCRAHPRSRVALFVGAERLHSLLLPAHVPLADAEARERYARLQFTHYFGPVAQDWPIASCADAACALTVDDPARLQSTAASHRVRLVSLRPSWVLAPAGDGLQRLLDERLVTSLRREAGRLVDLQAQHMETPVSDGTAPEGLLSARELLATAPVAPGPDFVPRGSLLRPLAWAWAGVAAAACALLAVQAQALREQAAPLAEQATLLDRLAHASAPAAAPPAAARPRAWQAARQLGMDWAGLWASLEQALPAGLSLTAMDLDARGLRLEGQADAADAVTQLADRLAMRAAAGEEVVLTRLQQPSTAQGPGQARRFTFELVRRPAGVGR